VFVPDSYRRVIDQNSRRRIWSESFDATKGFITLYIRLNDGRNKSIKPEGAMRFESTGNPGDRPFSPTLRD